MGEVIKKLQIGNVVLDNNLILAPMAGVTDLPFRFLCSEQGAGMVCMEMVSAKAILYKNKNTQELLEIHPKEGKVSLQLFGSDPDIISRMAAQIEERPFSILDINMGCPVPKVVNNKEGSALMKDVHLVEKIVSQTVRAIRKPVTVKIRKGFDKDSINAVEVAKAAQDAGAAAVAVHGRTREQLYAGKADWKIIAKVKQALSIPVIGNGDIIDGPSAKAMLEQTGCDGIMIGRAARGNPWIFNEIKYYLETNEIMPRPTGRQLRDMIVKHANMELDTKGEYTAVREMRKHIAWYTAGYPNSASLRRAVNQMETFEDLLKTVNHIFKE